MQLIAKGGEVKVIECNLRASRSFPFSSKVRSIGVPSAVHWRAVGRYIGVTWA